MLLVDTYIAPSSIHGIGLFANQDIPADITVWQYSWLVIGQDAKELHRHDPLIQHFVKTYGWLQNGSWYVAIDNARFINHAGPHANLKTDGPNFLIAVRDIRKGEELTEDYGTFDEDYPSYKDELIIPERKPVG